MAAIPTKGDNYQLVGRLKASSHSPSQEQLGPQADSFPASSPSSGTGQVRESGSESSCPTCGAPVDVMSGDEGTSYYVQADVDNARLVEKQRRAVQS